MARFKGKTVLITGGTKGIGRACALRFAREGAAVHATFARDEDAARQTQDQIKAAGAAIAVYRADMGVPDQVAGMWERVTAAGAAPDVLVLNAAYQKKASVDETDLELLEATFRVNVYGNFQLAKRFIAACREQQRPGVIVVHSSNQAEFVNPTGFAYALSKAALNHMVRHLAKATAADGIRVNGVLLGWFDTEGERAFYRAEEIRARSARTIPLGRAGDPAEAAALTAFLASDACSYMTGSIVRYDGGFALAPDLGT